MRWEWERESERTRERTRERVRESVRFRRVRWECCCHTPLSRVELVFRRSQWNNFQSTNECPRESSLPPQQRKRKKNFSCYFFSISNEQQRPNSKKCLTVAHVRFSVLTFKWHRRRTWRYRSVFVGYLSDEDLWLLITVDARSRNFRWKENHGDLGWEKKSIGFELPKKVKRRYLRRKLSLLVSPLKNNIDIKPAIIYLFIFGIKVLVIVSDRIELT